MPLGRIRPLAGALAALALSLGVGAASADAHRAKPPAPTAKAHVAHYLKTLRFRSTQIRCYRGRTVGAKSSWRCNWHGRITSSKTKLNCRGGFNVARRGRRWSLHSLGAVCAKPHAKVAAKPLPIKLPIPTPTRGGAAGFGFNDNSVAEGLVTPAQDVALEHEAGATVQRITFDWRWAEPTKGDYRLQMYDQLYAAMRAKGIRPIFILLFAPSWASASSCNQFVSNCLYPPSADHYADAAHMAAILAKRYPDAAGIEIWNEENLHWFWQPTPDPVAYSKLLAASYAAVKRANPSMPVVLGGLSNNELSADGDVPIADYLTTLYQHGAAHSMDAIGFHPYPAGASVALTKQVLGQVRAVRHRFGDDVRPLWATEIGLTTSSTWWSVNDAQQASTLTQIYSYLSSQPDVKMMIFHTLIENGSPSDPEYGYGVMTPNLHPRAAFCALAAARHSAFHCTG